MPFGSKPPFTLQTTQQTVKTLQALWNTRDPKQILTAYAPDCVWRGQDERFRPQSALSSNPDEMFTFLSGFFAYKQEYLGYMKLHDFDSRRLSMKLLAEYHGDRKHFEDPIFRQKHHDYPGKEGKRWKREAGLQYNIFDEYGRIQEVLNLTYHIEIKEKRTLLQNFDEGDQIQFPRIPMHNEVIEDDGPLRSKKCAPYYV